MVILLNKYLDEYQHSKFCLGTLLNIYVKINKYVDYYSYLIVVNNTLLTLWMFNVSE